MNDDSGRKIFLMGKNTLQLELMSNFIGEKIGLHCEVLPPLSRTPRCEHSKNLILYDSNEWNEDFKAMICNDSANFFASNFLVLINLNSTMSIECEALSFGVHGFLYEQDDANILLKMIDSVFCSELWVSRNVMTAYLYGNNNTAQNSKISMGLTSREIEILTAISQGRSNAIIADNFCISPHTVKTHIYNIFKKINVSSRLQAANWSSQHAFSTQRGIQLHA